MKLNVHGATEGSSEFEQIWAGLVCLLGADEVAYIDFDYEADEVSYWDGAGLARAIGLQFFPDELADMVDLLEVSTALPNVCVFMSFEFIEHEDIAYINGRAVEM